MVTTAVSMGIGPFTAEGLDEAFGLAVGLGPVGSCEVLFDAQLPASGSEGLGSVGGAVIGEDGFDADAVFGEEQDGLAESGDGIGDLFVWAHAGEAQAGVIVDGDVEGFVAGALVAIGSVAGGANAGLVEATELFDVQVDEFARQIPFVTDGRRRRGQEVLEAIEAVAHKDAVDGGAGFSSEQGNHGQAEALAAQGADLLFDGRGGLPRAEFGSAGMGAKSLRKAFLFGTSQPAASGFFANTAGCCCSPQC